MGLRPNIGIRGLNPTRSTKVLLLEDGIPLAYVPYGENASYYHPPVERFDHIEILKGAGQNIYGPQTVGGVINYVTPAPPSEFSGGLSLTAGNREYFNGHGSIGGAGMLLDYMRKQGDAARDNTHSDLNDLNFKSVLGGSGNHNFTVRANYYSEDSQLTYSGLTDAEFANFGAQYNPFKNDEFKADREGLSLTHAYALGGDAELLTNVYSARFNRDWWRQASTTTDNQNNAPGCAQLVADRQAGLQVNPDTCLSAQGRLREYHTYGVEPRLRVPHTVLGGGEFEAGLRAHYETQDRIQKDGTSPDARDGAVSEDNERLTTAYAAFLQNRFDLGAFALTPALRMEHVQYERSNRCPNPPSCTNPDVTGKTDLTEMLPSLAMTWAASEALTVFTGVHKGFAPPRTEDLISNSTGTSVDLDSEESWNSELGLRAQWLTGLGLSATAFRNDFSRQIAVGSIAGGNIPVATGETLYQGLEMQGRMDFGRLLNSAHNPFLELAYTWLPTADQQSALKCVSASASGCTGGFVNGSAAGKRLPYAPENTLTGTVGYANPQGFDVRVEAVYVDSQFADFANNETPNGTGLIGEIGGYTTWNAAVNYRFQRSGLGLFVTGKNLFDKVYIVDRTRGILPGAPRLVQAGVEYQF